MKLTLTAIVFGLAICLKAPSLVLAMPTESWDDESPMEMNYDPTEMINRLSQGKLRLYESLILLIHLNFFGQQML